MNEIKKQVAVELIEAQYKVAAHDAAEKERMQDKRTRSVHPWHFLHSLSKNSTIAILLK